MERLTYVPFLPSGHRATMSASAGAIETGGGADLTAAGHLGRLGFAVAGRSRDRVDGNDDHRLVRR